MERKSEQQEGGSVFDQLGSLPPTERFFDQFNLDDSGWTDEQAWHREQGKYGPVSVRQTSRYGEFVRDLSGISHENRPSEEGRRVVDIVRSRLAETGFDVDTPDSLSSRYLLSFGENLGRGLSPEKALLDAYDGEWCGRGDQTNRENWVKYHKEGAKEPEQWAMEDALGIRR